MKEAAKWLSGGVAQFWHWLTTSRYTRLLESDVDLLDQEVRRLRAENRGLLNSMLLRGGFQPVEDAVEQKPVNFRPKSRSWVQQAREKEAASMRSKEKSSGEVA